MITTESGTYSGVEVWWAEIDGVPLRDVKGFRLRFTTQAEAIAAAELEKLK